MAIKLIILLILAHQFHAVTSVILIGTLISTHPVGSKVKLTCVWEDGVLVWTTSTGDILFNEEVRYSKDEKYDNFKLEISGNQSSMIITNASFDDEGEYSCNDAIGKETILVKLEVAPRLIISYGGRQDPGPHIPSSSFPSISITCLAEGAKPEVSIRFKVGESDWLSPTNNEIAPRGVLFDNNATLNFQFIEDPNGNVVTCETSGQSSINPITETQTLITPNCNLETNKIEATCNCTSNPPVYKYILSINGKMEVGNTINVENLGGSNISCFGVNYIGVGASSSIVLESTTDSSFPVYVIIIVVVLFAVAVIALVVVYCWGKKHKSQASKSFQPLGGTPKDSKDTEHSESALPEENHLLSEDSNEKSEQNTKDLSEKGDGSPCADRKPMENSNVVSLDEENFLAKTSKQENNEKSSSDKSGSSPSEHNHGRFKPTDTENRNAQRHNQHGAAGTPPASENKKQTHAAFAVIGNKGLYHASPEQPAVQSTQRDSKHENNEKGSSGKSGSSPSEHNHGRFKPTDTEHVNAQKDNRRGAAGTPTDSENKKQPLAGGAVTGNKNQSQASPRKNAVQATQRDSNKQGSKEGSNEGNNGAKNKGENETNVPQEELEMLEGVFGDRSNKYKEAVEKSQHNQPVNSKGEGSKD